MVAEWTTLCRSPDLVVDGAHVNVMLGDGRTHRVTVEEGTDDFLLRAIVARKAIAASIKDLPLQAWIKNRAVSLVGFRIDHQGRLIGEAWVPKAGVTASEFQLYVRMLAIESDRFEYSITGRDSE